MGPLSGTVEEEIGRIAGRSHGVVTREELIRAGISPTDIRTRLRKGTVLRVYAGAYRAGVRYGTTPRQVEAVLARRPNSPEARKLREVMSGDVRVSLSKLEARFLSMLRAEGLSLPQTNRHAGGRRVDCRWPELKLTIEL